MIPSAYDLKDFYKTLGGRIVRRLIRERIARLWPDYKGLRIMGCGYATPYLRDYVQESERTFAFMFKGQGVHHWPDIGQNLVALSDEVALPLETNSVDRIIMVHSLEFTGFLTPAFEEMWRVLKSSGKIMIVVPNRLGLWARAERTPFGHGTPYSAYQVESFLKDNLFIPERTQRGLFIPPFKSQTLLRSAGLWEKVGGMLCPAMGGLLFVEASKQIYAGTARPVKVTSVEAVKAAMGIAPKPV